MQFQCVDRAGDDTIAAAGTSFGINMRYKCHDITTHVPCGSALEPDKVEKPAEVTDPRMALRHRMRERLPEGDEEEVNQIADWETMVPFSP
jgi:hypothetical protein